MAKKFLVPIDLNQLELQNVRLQNLASAPASPVIGQVYFNTTTNKAMCWDGTDWIPWEISAGNVTGVKGNAESSYRTGNVNITPANIGVEDGAQVNQNAFGAVTDGTNTYTAASETATLTFTAGDGIGIGVGNSGAVTIEETDALTYYATSGTAAGTAAKVAITVTSSEFVLEKGSIVFVKFTYANTASSPTLAVDNAAAKTITNAAGYDWVANEIVGFVYNGTSYEIIDHGKATTTYYGVTKLSSATNSTSTSLAATPSAVKSAYDLANTANTTAESKSAVSYVQNLANGTTIGTITIDGTTTTIYAPTPTGQVQADWTEADSTAASYIQNKPTLATVATTGSYTDLSNRPTLGTAAAKGVDTSISSGSTSTNLPTTAAVVNYVSAEIGAADAMRFKGTIGTGGTVTALPSTHQIGDTYRVITAGTYAGQVCEVGDLIIALTTSGTTASDWTVAQTNIDGAITSITGTGPISVTGSGSSRTVAHKASGVTAGSYGDSGAQTPSFGGTFKALYAMVNPTGHVTGISAHDVTIPNTAASTSSAGIVQLNNTVTSTSTSQAATANAVKTAYDRGSTGITNAENNRVKVKAITLTAGQTSVTELSFGAGQLISYHAYLGSTKEEVVLDVTIGDSAIVFSIASAITADITIALKYNMNLAS